MSKTYRLTLLFDIRAWQKAEFTAADDAAAAAYGRELADAIKTGRGIPTDHPIEDRTIETDYDGFDSATVMVDACNDDGTMTHEVGEFHAPTPGETVREAAPAMLEALEKIATTLETMDMDPRAIAAVKTARAAIAAARGEG
jgi:hypothetical protein